MFFCGLNKTTLLDYPGIVAATVFLGGCNFRCPYCHNMELVTDPAANVSTSRDEILSHLKKRSGILKGVCITGGEPTLNPDLPEFIMQCKDLGLKVKLDTNGTNPKMLKALYNDGLIDHVAMDIKAGPSDYAKVAGLLQPFETAQKTKGDPEGYKYADKILENVRESVRFLMNDTDREGFDYEFRTTVVKELFNKETFNEIADWIKNAPHYYIQPYKKPEGLKDPGFSEYTKEELLELIDLIKDRVPSAKLRGID